MICQGCNAKIDQRSGDIPLLYRNGHICIQCPNCKYIINIMIDLYGKAEELNFDKEKN